MMTTTEILTGIKNWVVGKLNLKQNVISDLASIRSGAQAGATSVQPADILSYFDNAVYDSGTHRINFYHGQSVIAYIDASPFIIDGMVNDVRIENGYLIIDFNTESGKQDISIPLTEIFDPSNYYNKTQTDTLLGNKVDKVSGKGLSTNDYTNAEKEKLSGLQNYDDTQVKQLIGQKQDIIQDLEDIRSGASAGATAVQPEGMSGAIAEVVQGLESGDVVPAMAETLAPWADQKAIATPDTYTDAVRTTGGDIPVETSAGSKLESIKPVAGSKWTAKTLFNGSYNMLNAAKWGNANNQSYVGGVGSDFVYFLVPELTLGTFGTADENNGLLFTNAQGENVEPTSVYFKSLGTTVPQSLTDGTLVAPTTVNYDGKTYKDYATDGAGWLIVPKTIYDNDVCAHIAWEDWYDKHVSLNETTTNPEAVVGTLILEGLLALAHSDKYLRGVNDAVCDNVVFGDTSATITHMVDEISVAANAWTNSATGESDSQGNALYRHSTTVSGIKQGGAACVEGEDGGIPLTVNGTTVSYIDTNATAPASTVFYEVTSASTTKAYTDSIFNGSNINTETGILPINDCSIEAQVAMDGEADITVKYAKNIVDQVAINATVDVPQIKEQVENHEERITELEDTAVRTGSYDASVSVGLADNLRGDTIVEAEFYKRKTGGTQSVGSGIAAIKEMRGKSIVWNQLCSGIVAGTNTTGTNIEHGIKLTSEGLYVQLRHNISTTPTIGHKYYFTFYSIPISKGIQNYIDCRINFFGDKITRNIPFGKYSNICQLQDASRIDAVYTCICKVEGETMPLEVDFINNAIIDLTLMFGVGNEPATVAEFEKMFPLDYYDYNAGEIIPFAGQNLVTTGFNQWDEAWEVGAISSQTGQNAINVNRIRSKNFIPILCNTTYYLYRASSGFFQLFYYDANKKYLGITIGYKEAVIGNQTTPADARYMRFYMDNNYGATYRHDICINISNPDRNGTYEPYEKHTLPLDPSQWRDKQGNLVFPYGGMHGVGTAYDYAKVDADGYIRKAVRCFDGVDMGTKNYSINGTGDVQYFYASQIGHKSGGSSVNALNNKGYGYNNVTPSNKGNKIIGLNSNTQIRVRDLSYSDATTFKSAMNGVMLYYELAEPIEVELATPVYAKYLVDKDGTEEITPANGATPYTTMANISILYAMDARGEIKNLPKNYLSKESAENMLNAMVSAGVIASYTMTYDAANARYQFTIVAPTQSNE